ncbi:MAG: PAS domain S-box protein [Desulfuromonadales bacterium]
MIVEMNLRQSLEFAENIINTVREPLIVLDQDLRVVAVNRSFLGFFRVKPEETVGQLIYDLGNKQWDIPKLRELLETILPKKTSFDGYEVEHDFATIGRQTMLLNARQIEQVVGKERIILLAIEDITERKAIENGLETTRKELETVKKIADAAHEFADSVINTVREPLISLDQDLRVVTVNRSFYDFFQVKPEETVGQLIYDLGNKQWDIPKLRELLETILPQKTSFDNYEVEHNFATIGRRTMLLNARQIEQVMGKERIILLAIEDITERSRLEDLLEESELRYRRLFETASDGIVLLEKKEGRVTHSNPAIEKMLGYSKEESLGKKLEDIGVSIDSRDFSETMQDLDREGILNYEDVPLKTKSGQEVYTDIYMVNRAKLAQCNIRDVSKRRKTEAKLHQSQKIEAVGTLAGGVAHDFNNMLGVILGHAEMALRKAPPSSTFISDLEEIRKAATRSADLTRQLLTFARKQVIAPKVLDLNDAVGGTLKMLQRLIGENIQLSWIPAANLWPVNVDPSQLDQILANLCVNARDAIAGIGKISIKTENSTLDENTTSTLPYEVVPGDYVRLSVSDDGCGMNKQVQGRIFEPFYTTKEVGSGTGLGLATVYGAVKQNHGFLTVYSEAELGTVFNIYLPRANRAIEAKEETAEKPLLRGTETILLVEDDAMLLSMATSLLEESGYTVLAAITTDLAQSFAKEHPGPIHLLISDMIMPNMNGRELSERLQPLRPEMKVLFLSGYTAEIMSSHGILQEGINFLQKPFSIVALSEKVREVLDGH